MARWARRAGALLLAGLLAVVLGLRGIGWWVDCGDVPEKADIAVVLGGGFARPLYGADLYLSGKAPQVWLSRVLRPDIEEQVRALGIALPPETEVNRAILLKKGVPAQAIRLYGDKVNSTVDEARALSREYGFPGRTILVVTSRFHARRARLVFRRFLPGARVLVCPTPYEPFDRRWWRQKGLALNSVVEMFKTAYYLAGLSFVQRP